MMHFDPVARVIILSKWHKTQLCDKFSSLILSVWLHFLKYSLMNKYVSLTTGAMKMGKADFHSDHSNGC